MERMVSMAGKEISPEQLARIREAAKYPAVYTKDSPELTEEQLAEFEPDNFDSFEERYQAMQEIGVIKEKEPVLV